MNSPALVLASASTIRATMLARAGVAFEVDAALIDEYEVKGAFRAKRRDAGDCAMMLAETKAARVAPRHRSALIIGADQMLLCGGAWLDKPRDLDEARRHLQALRGRTHELPTAVAVMRDEQVLWRHIERPRLTMRDFSRAFLDDYLAVVGDDALTSVGAYRLEGRGAQLFTDIEGDYFSILGLPLLPLLDFLRCHGVVMQ